LLLSIHATVEITAFSDRYEEFQKVNTPAIRSFILAPPYQSNQIMAKSPVFSPLDGLTSSEDIPTSYELIGVVRFLDFLVFSYLLFDFLVLLTST